VRKKKDVIGKKIENLEKYKKLKYGFFLISESLLESCILDRCLLNTALEPPSTQSETVKTARFHSPIPLPVSHQWQTALK
jgi:hypothetical protein